jgi:N4-gp56 family major capsid protein
MALTNLAGDVQPNFGNLKPDQKRVWSRNTWTGARNLDYWSRFEGKDENSMCYRVTDLTKTEKGDQCIFYLVADLVKDGVTGDNERMGNEEQLHSYGQIITLDLLSHSVGNKGKMSDQRTVINTREQASNRLKFWLADRASQLKFLTASGIDYGFTCDGRVRAADSNLKNLAFSGDVAAPSAKRALMWNGSALVPSVTASIDNTYKPTYKTITHLLAYAESHYVKPLMAEGKKYYNLLMHPWAFALLKEDQDYQRAVTTAYPRSAENPWFTGATVTVDGAVIHTHNYVFNTTGAASGSKWGAAGAVDGSRTLLCGAQAMAVADIGTGDWVEKMIGYDERWGINIDKIFGLLKPKFYNIYDQSVEDFGIVTCDHYIPS